jgi:hypothetical protein
MRIPVGANMLALPGVDAFEWQPAIARRSMNPATPKRMAANVEATIKTVNETDKGASGIKLK